jgi:hypothetical protein
MCPRYEPEHKLSMLRRTLRQECHSCRLHFSPLTPRRTYDHHCPPWHEQEGVNGNICILCMFCAVENLMDSLQNKVAFVSMIHNKLRLSQKCKGPHTCEKMHVIFSGSCLGETFSHFRPHMVTYIPNIKTSETNPMPAKP